MDKRFCDRLIAKKDKVIARFQKKQPSDYKDIVKTVIKAISDKNQYDDPDYNRIHEINDGDYQGTLLYVIGSKGYQPSDYWFVKVSYGSCSGCDTMQAIADSNEDQAEQYWTLALHVCQGLKKMEDND